jgi:hypothetical protein
LCGHAKRKAGQLGGIESQFLGLCGIKTIVKELSARCMIVAWSSASINSNFVKEAGLALAHNKLLPETRRLLQNCYPFASRRLQIIVV